MPSDFARYSFGYRCGTITSPTYEDPPRTLGEWLPQRTRWTKGWMQTWLVHMRNPALLWRQLGPGSFILFQVLFAGLVVSALVHPILLFTLLSLSGHALGGIPLDTARKILLVIDSLNIALGYGAFLLLGACALTAPERRGLWKVVLFTPIYWSLMSIAAWRALWQLNRRPHHWEKTPHRPRRLREHAAPARDRRAGRTPSGLAAVTSGSPGLSR